MKGKIFKTFKSTTAIVLVVVMLFAMLPNLSITADAAGQTSIVLKMGTEYEYYPNWGWTTHELIADGKMVYCINPELPVPPNGTYRTDKGNLQEISTSNKNYEMYNKAYYYCYGGAGFDLVCSAFKTDTSKHYLDPDFKTNTPHNFIANLRKDANKNLLLEPTGKELYYLLTHQVLSYINYGETKYINDFAGVRLPSAWITAVKELYNVIKKAPNPPIKQKIYQLNIGNDYQKILIVREGIKLQVAKSSQNDNVTYDLSGAKYNIYLDKACTDYFGSITTTSNGRGYYKDKNGNAVDVPVQNYYCKEVTPPKGFALDDTVYKFSAIDATNDGSVVYRATVKDIPYIKLQLLKSSANPDITDGNSCYSLKGAVYTVYTNKACTKEAGMSLKTNAWGYACYQQGDGTNTDSKDKDNPVVYKKNSGKNIELPNGTTYYCKETTAPPGFELDDTVYQFKDSGRVSSDDIKIFRAYSVDENLQPTDNPINDPVGIVLKKRNAVTGETVNQGLEGAIFQVQYYSQVIDKNYDVASGETTPTLDKSNLKRTWYIKTDEYGYCDLDTAFAVNDSNYDSDDFYIWEDNITPCVPLGTVVIREVEAPAGYFKSDTVFYRIITEEGAKIAQDTNTPIEVPIDEQPASGYIGINKMNNSRVGVEGAKYGLYSDSTATTLISTLITDSNGNGVFDVGVNINQTYYIKEIEAPPGYPLDPTIYPVVATEENTTVETAVIQDIYEDRVKGNIEILKSSNDGANSNLWFAVTDNLGNEYNAVATDENGKATVTGLPVYDANGVKIKYTVKELGYKTELGEHSYGGYTWTVKAENCILYKGAYYEGVANATFTDCDYAYSRFYYGDSTTATQNANGKTQTLTDEGTVTYSFVNTVPTTDLELYKTSFNGEVEGFYFDIVDQFGKSYGEIKTDDGGYACYSEQKTNNTLYSCIRVPNSAICIPMSYKAVELGLYQPSSSIDTSYYLPDYFIEAVETELTTPTLGSSSLITFDVYNAADTGQIDIVKSSDDGDTADICFKLSAYEIDPEIEGYIYEAPIGFNESGEPIYSIILKTDSEGKATTADYPLYDVYGNLLDGVLVYVDGMTEWEITYEIVELGYDNGDGTYSLPDRYVPNEPYRVELLEQRTVTYTCHNTVVSGSLQVQKTSEDDIVDSFWFKITAESIGYESIVSTDETGYTNILSDLPVYVPSVQNNNTLVEYTVTELGFATEDENGNTVYAVPNRYNKPKSVTVTLDTENVVTATIKNVLKRGNVTLKKQDHNGNALSGSEWALYNANDDTLVKLVQTGTGSYIYQDTGTEMTNLKTSTAGELYIYNLKQGDYYFVETKSAPGCMPYAEKVYFSIVPAETTVLRSEVIVTNNKEFLSQTGGTGTKNYLMLGCFSLITAIATISIYSKKRKMKGEKIL